MLFLKDMKQNLILIAIFTFFISLISCQFNQKQTMQSDRSVSSVTNEFDPNYFAVQKIFDTRCVACHSCYNAPCQLDLTSFAGLERGANRYGVFDFDLSNRTPTRMGIDANSAEEWKSKHKFFSVTEKIPNPFVPKDTPYSVIWNLLNLSKDQKYSFNQQGLFTFENHSYCPTSSDWENYLETNSPSSVKSMPFGFQPLTENELGVVKNWLNKGAHGPNADYLTRIRTPDEKNLVLIKKFEEFLNDQKDVYSQIVARYVYEHLHLAHVYFSENKNEFYRLIRSDRPRSAWELDHDIIELPTRRPTDDPGIKFYYVFKKITSTVVQKTHILYPLDEGKLNRWKIMFETDKPHSSVTQLPSRKLKTSLNPYITFKDLPVKARFQFLLDNNFYHVQSFILGPVCRGQLAVDSIDDHFWVFFVDPDHDPMLKDNGKFLLDNSQLLGTAGMMDNDFNLKMNKNVEAFRQAKERLYNKFEFTNDMIWKGIPDQQSSFPVLTVLRHFDNASVTMGPIGNIPKTIWVLDYQIFEELYYNLVAGYDVFSGRFHQVRTRLFMDGTRVNGQDTFLGFMPAEYRRRLRKSWHEKPTPIYDPISNVANSLNKVAGGDLVSTFPTQNSIGLKIDADALKQATKIFSDSYEKEWQSKKDEKSRKVVARYKDLEIAKNIKSILVQNWINLGIKNVLTGSNNNHFKNIQDMDCCNSSPFLPYREQNGLEKSFSAFARYKSANLDKLPDVVQIFVPDADTSKNESFMYTMIINKEHFSLDLIGNEDNRRDFKNDYVTVFKGFIGSFPNHFLRIPKGEIPEFAELMKKIVFEYDQKKEVWRDYYTNNKWLVKRLDNNFWSVYDAINSLYKQTSPLEAGVIDLSHYMHYYDEIGEVYR